MPSLKVDNYGISAVTAFADFFEEVLEAASSIKPEPNVEPPLEDADLNDVLSRLPAIADATQNEPGPRQRNNTKFAIIETAARGLLSNLIASVSIDSPDFVQVWNFFDVLQFLSDRGQCDPALLVWLIEELLDSQTIPGCRKIFDYLESRRKRIISKNFNDKKLVILRSCNELLRRLSRAEDTAFSGRVFIFLFQSLPPGDKSSVNLRGEYHTQNVTTFDQTTPKVEDHGDKMDVDLGGALSKQSSELAQGKTVSFSEKKDGAEKKALDPDALYLIFWSLQDSFNQPKKLFEPANLAHFKSGLEATMTAFTTSPVQDAKSSKQAEENKRGIKRKLESQEDDSLHASFNPKYLTSRDLFELEISDLSLRRYVLVQALILMDFLLSLSPQAKEQLASVSAINRSVAYLDQTISEDDIKWTNKMKADITNYLRSTTDGQYFLRMVETILSRDKNWVRWKIENCPLIERPPVAAQDWAAAMRGAKSLTVPKKARLNGMSGSGLSLDFLKEGDDDEAVAKLQDPERHKVPDVKSFQRGIADQDFEISMPENNESLRNAIEIKASMTWRALRLASRSNLALFDKIDSYENIDALFEPPTAKKEEEEEVMKNDEHEEGVENGVETAAAMEAPEVDKTHWEEQKEPGQDDAGVASEAMETYG